MSGGAAQSWAGHCHETVAKARGENRTTSESAAHGSGRVTFATTFADCPARSVPLPEASTLSPVPVTDHRTVPPTARSLIVH